MTGWRRNGRTGRRGQVVRSAGAPGGNSFSMVKGGYNGKEIHAAQSDIRAAENRITVP